jgi:hypothetical protein
MPGALARQEEISNVTVVPRKIVVSASLRMETSSEVLPTFLAALLLQASAKGLKLVLAVVADAVISCIYSSLNAVIL